MPEIPKLLKALEGSLRCFETLGRSQGGSRGEGSKGNKAPESD